MEISLASTFLTSTFGTKIFRHCETNSRKHVKVNNYDNRTIAEDAQI